MTDLLKRYIHQDGSFKAAIVNTTQTGRDVFQRIQPSPIGLQLLAQGMSGALLMASSLKAEGTMLFSAQGNGPGESLSVEANTAGSVRGTMGNPSVQFQPDTSLGLFQQTIGAGKLTVTRRTKKAPQPYQSVVDLLEGELAMNLANYLLKSDQTQSAIQLGATLEADKGIAGSGGILIQALPNADENILFILESRLTELPPLGELFSSSEGEQELVDHLFDGLEIQHMAELPVQYHCPCSRNRIFQLLAGIPKAELKAMRKENKNHELTCSFCNQAYEILPEDLDVLIEQAKG